MGLQGEKKYGSRKDSLSWYPLADYIHGSEGHQRVLRMDGGILINRKVGDEITIVPRPVRTLNGSCAEC